MLCLLYGNVPGYQLKGSTSMPLCELKTFSLAAFSELSDDILQRKVELCENVIAVYDKIDPGETTNRMNAVFELNCARIMKTKLDLQRNRMKRQEAIVSSYGTGLGRNSFFLIISGCHRRMGESNQKMLRCFRRRNGKQAHNGRSIRENPERKLYLTSMFTCCLSCFRKLCFLQELPLQACRRF